MKKIILKNLLLVIVFATITAKSQDVKDTYGKDWTLKKSPKWEELKKEPIPEWMIDAKFGMYTHWGIYSVPAHAGPDYLHELYSTDGKDRKGVIAYHEKKYGKIKDFGYKDFVPMFTADKFSAKEWVGVMNGGGAKFGGICLAHHDGFCLWDSKYTKWDSKDMGPKIDIFGEIAKEIRKTDMKLLATFHMARTYGYAFDRKQKYHTKEQKNTWDIFDKKNSWIYRNPATESKEKFGEEWANKVKEVIGKYRPDALWFDGLAGSIKNEEIQQDDIVNIFENYYDNKGIDGGDVVVCNKLPGSRVWNFPLGFGLRCYENCRDMEKVPEGYWLADRAISYPWSYVNDKFYKDKAPYQIRSLIDMVSRGGIMLMSLTPRGDGSIDPQSIEIMKGMGAWLKINGESIYATRKWHTPAEGPTKMIIFKKGKAKKGSSGFRWDFRRVTAEDIRFTRSKDNKTLYATALGNPKNGTSTITCLAKGKKIATKEISKITLVASGEVVKWNQTNKGLEITYPTKGVSDIANAFKIEFNGGTLIY